MRFFTNEVKIALVAIVGIVLLFFGLNFLKGQSLFTTDHPYYIHFDNIQGLSASNPIYADGFQVGVVKDIHYDYSGEKGVFVLFDADNELRIPSGTTAEIQSDLMGNVKVNLIFAHGSNNYMTPGDTLIGGTNAGLMGSVNQLMPTIQQMMPKLDSILTSVNQLLADPAIANSLHNVETISQNLTVTTAKLNVLMASLNTQVPSLMTKAGTAIDKANVTLDNTNTLTANLAAVDIAGTMSKVDHTLANVQSVTDQLNSKNGSLGLLINDGSLYNNLNATMQSADSLLTNLKAHPKRYVHFSIFGRKDR